MSAEISVILCAHNPHPGRLQRTLDGLRSQTLTASRWECIIVDNASSPPVQAEGLANARVVREREPGLSHARRRGLREAAGRLCVFVDDDNILAPDYLSAAQRIADMYPKLGAFGGRSVAEFEVRPAEWQREFLDLLAIRDLGPKAITSQNPPPVGDYPRCAPIGAGMALRQEAAAVWMNAPDSGLPDRKGADLSSGGDNDIVLTVLAADWRVGYFPDLSLTHIIPAARLVPGYLGRLNEGIQRSWVRVLSKHGICPWPPIADWSVPIRAARAWYRHEAWKGAACAVRWRGALGNFKGRADISSK